VHCGTHPQSSQTHIGVYPRRFWKNMACSFRSSVSSNCCRRKEEKCDFIVFSRFSFFKSAQRISGILTSPNRLFNSTRLNLSFLAFQYDSSEGVAEPRITLAECCEANTMAASRAWYLGAGSYCLKV